jgi:GNAT superfamily N-acetyltransferase
MNTAFRIRRATRGDRASLGRMGAQLLRAHYAFDPRRFMAPRPDAEEGYAWFLGTRLEEPDSLVLVAACDDRVVGYAYAAMEPRSWKELRDAAGFIHDVYVDEDARGGGVGAALVQECVRWLAGRGAPRVLLWTAAPNVAAQRLFERLGFRQTMIEMTREV